LSEGLGLDTFELQLTLDSFDQSSDRLS